MSKLNGDEIVISGISGCFPNADNIQQFGEKLFNKVDMVTTPKEFAHIKHPEHPKHLGKIKNAEKFDALFFRVTHWQAETLDPVARKLMEEAYAAIFDAGINPETLRGCKLGVFTASLNNDSTTSHLYTDLNNKELVISGVAKTMLANRISYWIDGKGPSLVIDQGYAGSMASLEIAYNRMKAGEIDCAIVGGCNLCLFPALNLNMKRAGLLCLDGKTKCFDKNGDGYVRSEAVSIYFLQKAKDAKRIYAEIYHVKGKFFAAPDATFSLLRNPNDTEKFLEEFYSEVDVSPSDVEYVEANAFGISASDGNELEAIGSVFAKNRTVNIGSVKSNMGNTEAASGACSVIKMCLAFQKGQIPANLHYNEPQNHIPAVKEGRLQVVTENVPFNRGFTAINSFCFTGSNIHALLKGHYKPKDTERYKSSVPRLVLVSGRNEASVNKMLDILETSPIDPEQCALLNNIFKHNVPGFTGRGYTILDLNENLKTVSLSRSFEFYSGTTRPVWFLYSGMGSQWAGMGEDLLRLPVFAAAIERCSKTLLPKGLDIIKIITDKDTASLNIINTFVGITAIQIGLTDVLKSLGIIPDKIIGHSVGELGCAYADESLTAEEIMLASYSRAIVSFETEFIKGKMAAVGLGFKEVCKICPPEIEVACHNSSTSATISGPADIVTEFIKSLTKKGIFAKEVASSNIAYHSRYIAEAGPTMLALLKQFIPMPKLRSNKWLSTCFPFEDWWKPECKYASADYFTHNLMSSVLFEETAAFIPNDAIIIEIAPHGLLQAIMKRSHNDCINIPLARRHEKDSVKFLFENIGKLFQAGLNPDVEDLYPKVEFPVSTETPSLSQCVQWEHSEDWCVIDLNTKSSKNNSSIKEYNILYDDDDFAFLKKYIRNGINVLPETAVLVFVWETFAEFKGIYYKNLGVVFNDVKFNGKITTKPEMNFRLKVTIEKGSNRFEVLHENVLIADGHICECEKTKTSGNIVFGENEKQLSENDIYTLLNTRGYSYGKEFQSIMSTNFKRNKATIKWNENWITFLDSMIQLNALSKHHDGVSVVKLINKLTINVDEHNMFKISTETNKVQYYNAIVLKEIGKIKCGGVIFEDIVLNEFPKIEIKLEILKSHQFFAHAPSCDVDLHTALEVNLQVLCENINDDVVNIKEIITNEELSISNKLKEVVTEIPLRNIQIETIVATDSNMFIDETKFNDANIFIFQNILGNNKFFKEILNQINENTYILTVENGLIEKTDVNVQLEVLTIMRVSTNSVILMRKAKQIKINEINLLEVRADNTYTVQKLKQSIKTDKINIIVADKITYFGVRDIINEVKTCETTYLFIIDANSPKFNTENNCYKSQINKGLKVNILENGEWGSYVYISDDRESLGDVKDIALIATELDKFESLSWIEAPSMSNKNTIQVYFSGLSTIDCKKLSNFVGNECFGMDYSGIDSRGNRVMGLLPQGTVSSTVEADCDLLWPVPQHWSLAEAVTVPLPYVHAFYCLFIRSTLSCNSNVFVMGAAGALGQAVISVALSLGCTVFATVGDAHKKRFLLKLFPELDENNICYTYETAFREMIVSRTNNRRCDLVFSCGAEKIREAAMSCVGPFSYFLDVNDRDQKENNHFPMGYIFEGKSYKAVNMSNIFSDKNYQDKKRLQVMLSEGIAKGFVRPLTSVVYAPSDISRAFKLLSNRSNRGRVLINMKDPIVPKVTPRITFSSTNTYVVVCDGTVLSVDLIDYLIKKGARSLLVHCNTKLFDGYFHVKYASWIKLGVTVEFNSDDLQTERGCQKLLENGNKLGPINGIFSIKNYLAPKSRIIATVDQEYGHTTLMTLNLDKVSRTCKELQYFVVIATVISTDSFDKNELKEIETCCLLRNELGKPSLFLRHILNDTKLQATASGILNAMELSLKYKYASVITSDSPVGNIDKPLYDVTKQKINTHFDGGLEAFYRHILDDEIIAGEPIVQMKTNDDLSYEEELLIDPEDTYIMMIPGFDGHYDIFNYISKRLKTSAMILQLDPDLNDSIPAIAKRLLNQIKKKLCIKSPFYLMGYSFGVNVALEIAALLEKEGLVGVVYCLDSSPDALRVHLDAYLGDLTDEQLQNSIVEHFYKLLAGHESDELKHILEETTKWSDKMEVFTKKVKNYNSHTHEYMIKLLHAAFDRMKMAKEYKPKLNLDSELVLIKGIPHPNAKHLIDDYNLSKYTDKPVQVFAIESDHALAPFDSRVSNFINRMVVP